MSRCIRSTIAKVYVDYIANRPRVEKIGEHGLFTKEGVQIVLSQVVDEVANHPSNVWMPIISMRREDAARLGYDSGKQWMELLRSYEHQLAKQMKIPDQNFHWYAAFHNEKVIELLPALDERLKNISGKKVYGYLQPDVKQMVDAIVNELAKSERRVRKSNLKAVGGLSTA